MGINDGIFLARSAVIMASEIANVHLEDIFIGNLTAPTLGKAAAISVHLGQKQMWDYAKVAEQEEKGFEDLDEQTVSVSRSATFERLVTISLLRLGKFEKCQDRCCRRFNKRRGNDCPTADNGADFQRTSGNQTCAPVFN